MIFHICDRPETAGRRRKMRRFSAASGMGLLLALLVLLGLAPGALAQQAVSWPQQITHEGNIVTVYMPALDSLTGTRLTGRSRIAVQRLGDSAQDKGQAWFSAAIAIDRTRGLLRINSIQILRVESGQLGASEARAIASVIESKVAAVGIVLPLAPVLSLVSRLPTRQRKPTLPFPRRA
jgi:hypothetical protein